MELLDWTGRQLHPNKCGAIAANTPPLLERLDIEPEKWMTLTQRFDAALPAWAGTTKAFQTVASNLSYRRKHGISANQRLFG